MFTTCIKIMYSFLLICIASVASAQEANQESVSFVNTATIRISTKLAEDEGRESATIDARRKAEHEAEEQLKMATKVRAKAERELNVRIMAEQVARKNLNLMQSSGGQKNIDTALDRLDQTVSARAAAEETAKTSVEEEQIKRVSLDIERGNRAKAEQAAKDRAQRRAQQSTKLEALKERWRLDPTEENLTEFSETITAVAAEEGVKANVTWKSTPTSGATIFYQTKRARQRGDQPESIANPTETPQEIVIGRYYVWAERGGKATSNKDRLIPIVEKTDSVTVIEDGN